MFKFLRTAAFFVPMLAIVTACSGSTAPKVTPAQVITDAQNALMMLKVDAPLIPGLKPEVVAAVVTDADKGLAVLAALSTEAPAVDGAKAIAQVEGFINAALIELPAVLPPPYNLYAAAAAAIVPSLEAYVASVTTVPVSGSVGVVVKRAGTMTPVEGSAVLSAAVATHH